MIHLLEMQEFNTDIIVKQIIDRINRTGYLSHSLSKNLDKLTGIPNTQEMLLDKAEGINFFFSKCRSYVMDDILLEFLDYYDYTIDLGIYIDDYHGGKVTLGKDYEDSDDKENFIFIKFLEFLYKSSKESREKSKEDLETRKSRRDWLSNPRGRNVKSTNYFKKIGKIEPMVIVTLKNRGYDNYFGYTDRIPLDQYEGFTDNDFYGREGSVDTRIKKRMRSFEGVFGAECKDVRLDYQASYTSRSWYDENDEHRTNPNPILMHGKLDIKFKLL
jgi:hypothetical protein